MTFAWLSNAHGQRRDKSGGLFWRIVVFITIATCNGSFLSAQPSEFNEPWRNPNVALAIDPFEGNEIDWERLVTEKRVVAIIHRATIGDRVDRKYHERRVRHRREF
jgi:hypothetical protein